MHSETVATEPATHDYTDAKRGWGHDIAYCPMPGDALRAHGWGPGRAGDFILLSNGESETRYRFGKDFRRPGDPADMWASTLYFSPRGVTATVLPPAPAHSVEQA